MKREVTGVLLLDKPAGISSNSALGRVKRLLGAAKAGHTGTLDPFATGLLPIALGEAAKFSRFLLDAQKGYRAHLRLGVTTATGDTEGAVVTQSEVRVTAVQIQSVLKTFTGILSQVPPMHSALKRDGVPLYKLARKGIEIEREPRRIVIEQLSVCSWDGKENLIVDVLCSKGTYIRVLAEDVGRALGCGAHLGALRRTRVGSLDLGAAIGLDELEKRDQAQREALLSSADSLAVSLPALTLGMAMATDIQHGKKVVWAGKAEKPGEYRIYREDGVFVGVCQLQSGGAEAGGQQLVAMRLMAGTNAQGKPQLTEFA